MAEGLSFARAVREIARNEVRLLARDRRALFSAVILPALIYPLFFHGQSWLRSFSSQSLAERTVRVALDLETAPPDIAGGLRSELVSRAGIELADLGQNEGARRILRDLRGLAGELHEGRPEAIERRRELASRLLGLEVEALVSAQPHPVLPARQVLHLYHDGSNEASTEALARVQVAVAALADGIRSRRLGEALGAADPASGLDVLAVDLASAEDTGGAVLGRLLPVLAVLVLVSGASFAALRSFAGEREAGTLETLLVQPLPPAAVAWGKFYAVLAVGLAALACNVGSLLVSLTLGLGALPGLEPGQGAGVVLAAGGGRLASAALLFLPTAVVLSALLALISARARSLREGQHLLLPLTLAVAVPAGIAGWTDVPLDALTALAPVFGPCLAVRDALRGSLETGPALITLAAGVAWALLALRALAAVLSAESVLQQGALEEEAVGRRLQSRTALAYGAAAALLTYVVGGWLQAHWGLAGLLLTLWGALPVLAFFCARRVASRAGESLRTALWWRWPSPAHAAGALLCAPALAGCVRWLADAQARVAPLPSRLLETAGSLSFLTELGPLGLFCVLALSPGICEELLYRGAILSGLRRDLTPGRVVFWQALLFGAAHASIHRFLPTAAVGALLTVLTLRTRSLVPAILLHVAYDGLQVLAATVPWTDDASLALLALPGVYLLWREPGRERLGLPAPQTA